MNAKKTLYSLFLLCLAPFFLLSLDTGIYAPYVSNIRVISLENAIRLSWKNSGDIEGDLHIFRHTQEITAGNFRDAYPVARIRSTENEFVDHPDDVQEYYYLVLGTDIQGDYYRFFIPFRNVSTLGVSAGSVTIKSSSYAQVSNLDAEIHSDSVILTYSASGEGNELIIYRHTDPVGELSDIINATRIAVIPANVSSYTDYPIPGITYFYTVVDAQSVKDGSARFIFGKNSLGKGVRISPGTQRSEKPSSPASAGRPRPLPYLLLSSDISTGRAMKDSLALLSPSPHPLSPDVQEMVKDIVSRVSEYKSRITNPHVLDVDINPEATGEQNTLIQIVRNRLLRGEYKRGIIELASFLSLRRTREINYRGRYYLGQCYYFSGDYQKAFLEFLIAEEEYYPEVKPWLEDIFYILRSERLSG